MMVITLALSSGAVCLFAGEDLTSPGLPRLALALMLTDSDL